MKTLKIRWYGKYSIFAVVFALVFLVSSSVFAEDDVEDGIKNNITGQEHRNEVSDVVRELRRVGGQPSIGEEVRQVAQDEEDSAKRAEEAMNKINKIGRFRTIFIGTDYKNLGVLRSEIVKTQNAIERLTKAMERAIDINIKADLQKQIDALKAIKIKTETFIKDHESQFSFLGWFVRLFNR
jgi:hypothetical protein